MPANGQDETHDTVIIGGGPTAVAAFCALVRHRATRSIAILDPAPVGFGNVFGERCAADPLLLCNSSNGLTWVDAGNSNDFVEFLRDRGWAVSADDHVPRYLIGEYCRQRFLEHMELAASRGISVTHLPRRGLDVECRQPDYLVHLDDGTALKALQVLVCTGLEVPKVPQMMAPYADDPRYLPGAYPASVLRDLPKGARVLVLGLRSSAQDAMLVLIRSGHHVTMTSPSGRVSSVRDVFSYPARSYLDTAEIAALSPSDPDLIPRVVAILSRAAEARGGIPLEEQISAATDGAQRLREDLALAEAGKTHWSDLLFETINAINAVVGTWSAADRARVMPSVQPVMSRFIASLPLLSARRLVDAIDAGSVVLSPVYLKSIGRTAAGWQVEWQDGRVEAFDYIVSTSGYHFPRFPLRDGRRVGVSHAGTLQPGTRLAEIGGDLRLRLGEGGVAERIWMLGAATNQRFPFAHLLWLAAQHAEQIARTLAAEGERASGLQSRTNEVA